MFTKRRGFTLIELLVVIAIIAILAAILFPVFARARAKAQQSNCLSNVKQISLGVLMYASDYDDRFPMSWDTTGGMGFHWDTMVYPYVKNLQIFNCPGASGTGATWADNPVGGYGPMQKLRNADYAENGCLGSNGGGNGCSTGTVNPALKQASINRPAEMIMIFGTANTGWYVFANPDGGGGTWAPSIETRHNEGGNVGYVDGHAKWQTKEILYRKDGSAGWNNTP